MVGPATSVLAAERTALGLLCRMSGIATLTRRYVDAISGTHAVILGSRKAAPCLGVIDQWAIQLGGGGPVPTQLSDEVFIHSSHATLAGHFDRLRDAFAAIDPLICFSMKSSSNLAVCRALAERGAGMDLVSGGELHRALAAGIDPGRCVYAGVGKTDVEIRDALAHGVGWLNVESEAEFENISAIAHDMGVTCRTALRVNPDVDPATLLAVDNAVTVGSDTADPDLTDNAASASSAGILRMSSSMT